MTTETATRMGEELAKEHQAGISKVFREIGPDPEALVAFLRAYVIGLDR